MSQETGIILSFILYLGLMLFVGWFFYKRTQNLSDYILGGRQLNKWVTSLSAQASDMSGWLLLGLPGLAYLTGMGEAFWVACGLALGTYLNWKFVAKRLRQYTQISGNSLTLPDYFENRFRDHSKILRIVSAVFILIFFLIYTAAQFAAGAKLFNTVFGVPYLMGLAIGALVIISYTFMGGFMAVCWTDFFQGMLMFFAILIVPIAAVFALGGTGVTLDKIAAVDPAFLNIMASTGGKMLTVMTIVSSLAWGLGYFGMPHILVRFMAIRSSDEIKPARTIAMVWVLISLAAALFVGVVGRVYLTQTLEGAASETVFMVMVNQLFPTLIAGILLAAILAATMSTADSQLLVTSSAISQDFYKALFRKNAGDKELVLVGRLTVVGVSVLAFILAINPDSSVFKLVSYAWAGFGAAFGPTILLSLFWKRMTKSGALAGIVTGGITVLIWQQLKGGIFDLYEIVPGFILSVIAIVIVSLLDKQPSKEIQDEFESVGVSKI
ncbi:sodium/proline symporter PutP [Petroclostridium sp. X23]|uniref:sodium/proline symporter PutP n=1 Tax=Petroclostridium sp. X23 TaxID=3045146 RepID=UPI0024AE10EB|nr:sodium/proline symporter PutP [Petroclostridium sp. X23]WHH61761.1 sodium/proline symporter PutP [Petroclostridium sp. X23]